MVYELLEILWDLILISNSVETPESTHFKNQRTQVVFIVEGVWES